MKDTYSPTRRLLLCFTGLATFSLPAVYSRKAIATMVDNADIEQPASAGDRAYINRAFTMRDLAVQIGDQAFGAIVVRDGRIVGQSASHVVVHGDPTAHAEMEAIRDAANRLSNRDLSGCTLYSSSRACPMCEAAAYWANIDRMVYGKSLSDAGKPSLC
jgi:tRNA(Arg) A34 adenosine deaminase TadA